MLICMQIYSFTGIYIQFVKWMRTPFFCDVSSLDLIYRQVDGGDPFIYFAKIDLRMEYEFVLNRFLGTVLLHLQSSRGSLIPACEPDSIWKSYDPILKTQH